MSTESADHPNKHLFKFGLFDDCSYNSFQFDQYNEPNNLNFHNTNTFDQSINSYLLEWLNPLMSQNSNPVQFNTLEELDLISLSQLKKLNDLASSNSITSISDNDLSSDLPAISQYLLDLDVTSSIYDIKRNGNDSLANAGYSNFPHSITNSNESRPVNFDSNFSKQYSADYIVSSKENGASLLPQQTFLIDEKPRFQDSNYLIKNPQNQDNNTSPMILQPLETAAIIAPKTNLDKPLPKSKSTKLQQCYKVELCLFYERNNCKNGDACTFAHGPEELRQSQRGNNTRNKRNRIKKIRKSQIENNTDSKDFQSQILDDQLFNSFSNNIEFKHSAKEIGQPSGLNYHTQPAIYEPSHLSTQKIVEISTKFQNKKQDFIPNKFIYAPEFSDRRLPILNDILQTNKAFTHTQEIGISELNSDSHYSLTAELLLKGSNNFINDFSKSSQFVHVNQKTSLSGDMQKSLQQSEHYMLDMSNKNLNGNYNAIKVQKEGFQQALFPVHQKVYFTQTGSHTSNIGIIDVNSHISTPPPPNSFSYFL